MFNFIDKVVYINLEDRSDRKEQIEKELSIFPSDKIVRFNAIKHQNGGIGCVQSHVETLELAIREGWKNVLILEDDSMWSNFDKGYNILEKLVESKFDVIMLGSTHASYTKDYKVISAQSGNAYLVSNHYYQTLLENLKEALTNLKSTGQWHIYANDQYWKRLQAKDNWYCVVPSLMIQRPSYSNIERRDVNYINYFS